MTVLVRICLFSFICPTLYCSAALLWSFRDQCDDIKIGRQSFFYLVELRWCVNHVTSVDMDDWQHHISNDHSTQRCMRIIEDHELKHKMPEIATVVVFKSCQWDPVMSFWAKTDEKEPRRRQQYRTSKSSLAWLCFFFCGSQPTDESWSVTKETSRTVKSRFQNESWFQICRESDLLRCQKPWFSAPQIRVNNCLCAKHPSNESKTFSLLKFTKKKKKVMALQAQRCIL